MSCIRIRFKEDSWFAKLNVYLTIHGSTVTHEIPSAQNEFFIVAITLFVHSTRALNEHDLMIQSLDVLWLGRRRHCAYGTTSAHWGYLDGKLTSRTAFNTSL